MAMDLNLGNSIGLETLAAVSIDGCGYLGGSLQITQDAGNLVKLANVRSPLDKPSTAKISVTRIPNVYQTLAKGTVPVSAQNLNTSGNSIFTELNVMGSKTVGSNTVLLPMQSRLELKLPMDSEITDAIVKELILSTLAVIWGSLVVTGGGPRINEIMRGILFHETPWEDPA